MGTSRATAAKRKRSNRREIDFYRPYRMEFIDTKRARISKTSDSPSLISPF